MTQARKKMRSAYFFSCLAVLICAVVFGAYKWISYEVAIHQRAEALRSQYAGERHKETSYMQITAPRVEKSVSFKGHIKLGTWVYTNRGWCCEQDGVRRDEVHHYRLEIAPDGNFLLQYTVLDETLPLIKREIALLTASGRHEIGQALITFHPDSGHRALFSETGQFLVLWAENDKLHLYSDELGSLVLRRAPGSI